MRRLFLTFILAETFLLFSSFQYAVNQSFILIDIVCTLLSKERVHFPKKGLQNEYSAKAENRG
jgi:5-methylcytosine-specific restriction endonuclease McrBC regulatory subunit McrC